MKFLQHDPYSWNTITLQKNKHTRIDLPSPTYAKMNANALMIGKLLGVDVAHGWSDVYQKVWDIYQTAKVAINSDNPTKLVQYLEKQKAKLPSMSGSILNDLHLGLDHNSTGKEASKRVEKRPVEAKPKPVVKVPTGVDEVMNNKPKPTKTPEKKPEIKAQAEAKPKVAQPVQEAPLTEQLSPIKQAMLKWRQIQNQRAEVNNFYG